MDVASRLFRAILEGPRFLRRPSSRFLYDLISRGYRVRLPVDSLTAASSAAVAETTFMNFGYHDRAFDAAPLDLPPELEAVRYPVQLYAQLVRGIDLRDVDLIEVGSGRGGGCRYLAGRGPRSVTGVDLSREAVSFCQRALGSDRLRFLHGDAARLPLDDASADVVVNVESSGCYPDFDAFLREVVRVLRPGGWFCWTDARFADAVAATDRALARTGFEVVEASDISADVVRGLSAAAPAKARVIAELPRIWRPVAAAMLATPGSTAFKLLANGRVCYLKRVLRAPGGVPA